MPCPALTSPTHLLPRSPLGWLVPSEIQTLETRPAGMSAAVSTNFLFSFVIGE